MPKYPPPFGMDNVAPSPTGPQDPGGAYAKQLRWVGEVRFLVFFLAILAYALLGMQVVRIISPSYNEQFLLTNPTLLDSARDSQVVHLASDKRFQDQQVQSPLQKACRSRLQSTPPIGSL